MADLSAIRVDDTVGYPAVLVQNGPYDYYFRFSQAGMVSCYRMLDANGSRDKSVPRPTVEIKQLAMRKLAEDLPELDLFGPVPPRPVKKGPELVIIWATDRSVELQLGDQRKRLTQGHLKNRDDLPKEAIRKAVAVMTIQRQRKRKKEAAEACQTKLFPDSGAD